MNQYCKSCGIEHDVTVPRGHEPFDCDFCKKNKSADSKYETIIKKLEKERDEAFKQIRDREDGGDWERLKQLKLTCDKLETDLTEARSEVVKWARRAEKAETEKRLALEQVRKVQNDMEVLRKSIC